MTIQEEDEPLDPTLERVRRKMLRLMTIAIGIMMIGLMAVLFAIVYKISSPSKPNTGETLEIDLQGGAEILSTTLSGERILVDTRLPDGSRELILIDADSGKIVSRIAMGKR